MVVDAALLFRLDAADRMLLSRIAAKLERLRLENIEPTHVCVHAGRLGGWLSGRVFGLEVVFSSAIEPDAAYLMIRA